MLIIVLLLVVVQHHVVVLHVLVRSHGGRRQVVRAMAIVAVGALIDAAADTTNTASHGRLKSATKVVVVASGCTVRSVRSDRRLDHRRSGVRRGTIAATMGTNTGATNAIDASDATSADAIATVEVGEVGHTGCQPVAHRVRSPVRLECYDGQWKKDKTKTKKEE